MTRFVYLAGLSNGVVKCGYTESFHQRYHSIRHDVNFIYRLWGSPIKVIEFEAVLKDAKLSDEKKCLDYLRTKGVRACAPKREYFSGLDFHQTLEELRRLVTTKKEEKL